MKTKARALVKTLAITCVIAGALYCWAAKAADTQEIWDTNCAACHGKDGKGQTMMGRRLAIKDYTDPKVQASFTDEQAIKIIKDGVTEDGKTRMKAFGDKLNEDEIKALVKHVRSFSSK